MTNDNIQIKVDGLRCNSCVFAVENSIKELDGVEDAKADLDSGILDLKYDSDKVTFEDIDEAVKEAGFSIKK